MKYLGIIIDDKLQFKDHCEYAQENREKTCFLG